MFRFVLLLVAVCLCVPVWAQQAQLPSYKTTYKELNDGETLVVLVGATWCPACITEEKELATAPLPVGTRVVKLDQDLDAALARQIKVGEVIPQVHVWQRQNGVYQHRFVSGFHPLTRLRNYLRW